MRSDEEKFEDLASKLLLQGYPPLRAIDLADEFVMELNKRAQEIRLINGPPQNEP